MIRKKRISGMYIFREGKISNTEGRHQKNECLKNHRKCAAVRGEEKEEEEGILFDDETRGREGEREGLTDRGLKGATFLLTKLL